MSRHDDYFNGGKKAVLEDSSIVPILEEYADLNITLAAVPDQRMTSDRDQAFELGVMYGLHEMAQDRNIDLHMGSLEHLVSRNHNGRNRMQRMALMPRYGFLESTCRLHDFSSILAGMAVDYTSWLEPGIDRRATFNPHWPNDFSFWYTANWASILADKGLGPKTWFDKGWKTVPDTKSGAWVVKGTLRSVRQDWSNRMYADSREKLERVMQRLYDDSRISQYGLMIREYIPIMTLGDWDYSIKTDLHEKVEFRVHVYNGIPFFSHYYWNSLFPIDTPQNIIDFAVKCYEAVEYDGWMSVDVGVGVDGNLFCVEMNCGPSSGSPAPQVMWPNFIRAFTQAHKDNDAPLIFNRF